MLCLLDWIGIPLLRVPKLSAPLWHSRQTENTTGRRSSLEFIDPCGLWQISQPSTRTGGCSNTNGPRFSTWHFIHGVSAFSTRPIIPRVCAILHVPSKDPCRVLQTPHRREPP